MNLLIFFIVLSAKAQFEAIIAPVQPAVEPCQILRTPKECQCKFENGVTIISCSCQRLWDEKKEIRKSSLRYLKNADCLNFYFPGCPPKKFEGATNLCEKLKIKKSEIAEVYTENAECAKLPNVCPENATQTCSESSGHFVLSCSSGIKSQFVFGLVR